MERDEFLVLLWFFGLALMLFGVWVLVLNCGR